ncbi:Com family DNA-binding transcriptional regulator [uncultured Desulfovibrio sp.]|uniref:Com family DNA-binding transcriptional regulator n=1 Tax=uncultured Desulfovibrio sp. TaxID=167968 RepID=UPI00261E64CB|nr:Com family DNA-binding transcriptional regulator [uncultured Desulfovibrio sp.]
METITEIRCRQCGKLLAKGRAEEAHIEFKCPRCGAYTILRATRPGSEPPDGHQEHFHATQENGTSHAGSQRLHI